MAAKMINLNLQKIDISLIRAFHSGKTEGFSGFITTEGPWGFREYNTSTRGKIGEKAVGTFHNLSIDQIAEMSNLPQVLWIRGSKELNYYFRYSDGEL